MLNILQFSPQRKRRKMISSLPGVNLKIKKPASRTLEAGFFSRPSDQGVAVLL